MRTQSLVVFTLVILALALPTVAMAADPSAGTWKLSIAQSQFPPNADEPKEETLVKIELGDQFQITGTGIQNNGKAISETLTHAQQGGVIKIQQPTPAEGESGVVTVISPGNFYVTGLQNGKQIRVEHHVVSKDGKTLSETVKGTDAKGKPYEYLYVWNRQ